MQTGLRIQVVPLAVTSRKVPSLVLVVSARFDAEQQATPAWMDTERMPVTTKGNVKNKAVQVQAMKAYRKWNGKSSTHSDPRY
jgi:hypothetical protein